MEDGGRGGGEVGEVVVTKDDTLLMKGRRGGSGEWALIRESGAQFHSR